MVQKHKILVVDDDHDIGRMIKMLLEFKGYDAVIAENRISAEEILQQFSIKVIIMDMLLSGENGINVCAAFKRDAAIMHIPILMMSAHPDANTICMDAGANDFISKPFEMQDLLLKIDHLINGNVEGKM